MISPVPETLSSYITVDSLGRKVKVTLSSNGSDLPRNTVVYLESVKVKAPNKGDNVDLYA